MVNSKLLYAAPVWTSALKNHAIQKKLFSAQRGVVLRIVSIYRTVKELTCLTNLQEIARAKEAIRKDGRRRLVEK